MPMSECENIIAVGQSSYRTGILGLSHVLSALSRIDRHDQRLYSRPVATTRRPDTSYPEAAQKASVLDSDLVHRIRTLHHELFLSTTAHRLVCLLVLGVSTWDSVIRYRNTSSCEPFSQLRSRFWFYPTRNQLS